MKATFVIHVDEEQVTITEPSGATTDTDVHDLPEDLYQLGRRIQEEFLFSQRLTPQQFMNMIVELSKPEDAKKVRELLTEIFGSKSFSKME